MSWAVKLDKPFFVGQRSLKILNEKARKQVLVGFAVPGSYRGPALKESHLVIDGQRIIGRITSVAFSESLGHFIGLMFIEMAQSAVGSHCKIRVDGKLVEATVVKTPFYDPEGARQKLEESA